MSRHYSKVFIELPEDDTDPPYAVIEIDCDTCGKSELKIHMQHLGTVHRIIGKTVDDLFTDDAKGFSEPMSGFVPSTPVNKQKVREFLDRTFPGWVQRRRSKDLH